MDFANPFAFENQSSHPMWDYETVLQQLEQTKQCCPFVHGDKPRSKDPRSSRDSQVPPIPEHHQRNLHQESERRVHEDINTPIQQQMMIKIRRDQPIISEQRTRESSKLSENDEEAFEDTGGIINRRRRSKKLNIKAKLIKLRDRLLTNREASFKRSMKKRRCTKGTTLKRRSQYIGVSKNNTHWQALITVKRVKRYIGIFFDELEAARTYDLYALAMKGKSASLNFDYTCDEMLEVINFYLAHDRINMEPHFDDST
ncbi:unnamed protein product [Moneuplotes crassus]|uniref:AP2/ERF domain-containing protein n=1 Tax=Euplotes crassus TaxID=5936 RepID=A0AAD1XWZ0_EUPCR|nr:unnamed protein product [Moneuplotes crassus]